MQTEEVKTPPPEVVPPAEVEVESNIVIPVEEPVHSDIITPVRPDMIPQEDNNPPSDMPEMVAESPAMQMPEYSPIIGQKTVTSMTIGSVVFSPSAKGTKSPLRQRSYDRPK